MSFDKYQVLAADYYPALVDARQEAITALRPHVAALNPNLAAMAIGSLFYCGDAYNPSNGQTPAQFYSEKLQSHIEWCHRAGTFYDDVNERINAAMSARNVALGIDQQDQCHVLNGGV